MNTNPFHYANDDWALLGVILGAPLLSAFFNGVFGKRVGKNGVRWMTLVAMGVSFLAALATFMQLHTLHHLAEENAGKGADGHEVAFGPSKLSWLAWSWMSMATGQSEGRMTIDVKFSVDELSGVMMLVITGVGFLIHLYSTSYMAKDPGYHRYFAYLNLFVFAMLTLVLADNMPLLFVGWEGVGLCSYLLIGFWFENVMNAAAGRKAFIANRIGDVGIIAGMLILAQTTGALDWDGIARGSDQLTQRLNYTLLWSHGQHSISYATVACLCLFLGCTGKSAQIPLYVWLPDAMAGPTPVSALIHAATMVTSGLYLICRLNIVFTLSPFAMMVVAITGAATAFFAATIALVQNDIKKVLAYSTVSQLGFMFLGVGVGAFSMGFFHVFTHAFFKACLFLGAGSVIHAMHARVHDDVKSQDMRHMGGLRKYMPWTFASMGAATFAIAGFPFTSGFFSKDGILAHVWTNQVQDPNRKTALAQIANFKPGTPNYKLAEERIATLWEAPAWLGKVLFVVAILAATMTAFYIFRLLFKTFWGEFKGWKVADDAALATNPFENEEPLEDDEPARGHEEHAHDHHADNDAPGEAPKEAPWAMTLPVAILGVFALFAGFLYAEPLEKISKGFVVLGSWLDPVFHRAVAEGINVHAHEANELLLMAPGILAFAIGCGLAYFWYVVDEEKTPKALAASWPVLHRTLYNKWYVDEIYEATIIGGTDALADGAALMDQWIVDGIIAKLTAAIVSLFGTILRAFQTGVVQLYSAVLALGTLALMVFFGLPHADVTTQKEGSRFVVEAAPGLGYSYRWDVEGLTPETDFTTDANRMRETVIVDVGQTKRVTLEVKNAFGRTTKRVMQLANPSLEAATAPSTAGAAAGAARAPGVVMPRSGDKR